VPGASKSYLHRGGETPLLGRTIPEHFRHVAEKFRSREAVVSIHQSRRLTYADLSSSIDHLARGLLGMGIRKGDRVGIWSTNNIEWLLLQMATARMGAILVTVNPAYRVRELSYALQRSEVSVLFLIPVFRTSDYVGMLCELLPDLRDCAPSGFRSREFPHLRRIVLYDPASPAETVRPVPGFSLWQEVLSAADGVPAGDLREATAALDMDDTINIQFTSGTTGFPKAVMLTHHNILNNAYFSALAMGFTEQDRLCVPVPFYHCFGMVLANLLCLSVGACLVLPAEYFDAGAVLSAIEQERCTGLHGVPTMFVEELEHPRFAGFDLSSLRTGIMAGAPCPPALMERVIDDMGCRDILIGYGETEASPITHLTSRQDSRLRRIETVGRNLPHQEVKVIHPSTGETLPVGEVGEICFRGYHIMQGYYGDPEATAKAIDENGWLRSGDLGTMDEDGYLRITGRLKEMIIRGGENIYPREIEDFLFSHPAVAGVAVFGIPDDLYGEEVMAWIKLRAGTALTAEEVKDFCRDKIAHFKVPRHIWFVDEFPLTVTGKIQRYRMREIAIEKMKGQGAPAAKTERLI